MSWVVGPLTLVLRLAAWVAAVWAGSLWQPSAAFWRLRRHRVGT
jgi:hypothetical protein